MLTDLAEVCGEDRSVGVARELTKAHEELVIRPIRDLFTYFQHPRGEFTVLLPPEEQRAAPAGELDPVAVAAEFGELTENRGLKRREALKILAERYGVGVNALYRLLD